MAFTVEEIYKTFKIQDEKLPFRAWIKRKIKKKEKKSIKKRKRKKDGHIDIYA